MPLSESAMQLLLQTGMRRDAGKTCSEKQLRHRLQGLGLWAYEAAISFEHDFGGMVWDGKLWGTYAALLGRTLEDLWSMTMCNAQARYHGEALLPVGVYADSDCSERFVKYWISRDGWILLDTGDEILPEAESATCFFERETLRRGLVHKGPRAILRWREIPTGTVEDFARFWRDDSEAGDDDPDVELEPRYLSDPERLFDQQLAEALALPLYRPASDGCMHIWYDGSSLLFPYQSWVLPYQWESGERVLRGTATEDVARMIVAAARIRSTAGVIWEGPRGEAPAPGEEIAAEVAAIDDRENWTGHLLLVGKPGNYRVHARPFDQPRSIARLWEERRDAWETQRQGDR